jgi:hypothetical protein
MSPKMLYTAAAVAAALSLAVVPADAQSRRGQNRDGGRARTEQGGGERQSDGRRGDGGGGRAVRRSSEARQAPVAQQAPRYEPSRQASAAQQTRQYSEGRRYQSPQGGQRDDRAPSNAAPQYRSGGSDERGYSGSQRGSAYSGNAAPRPTTRGYGGYQSQGPRYSDRRGYAQPGVVYGRDAYRGYVRPPHYQPYRPFYFSRPYYGFRPHVHVGFGVWLGVSVPYPWAYFGTYRPRVYGSFGQGYYGQVYVGVAPAVQQYGGVSFDIQPADADVFVDGEYVGFVGTFTPYGEPLTLYPGVHRIAIVRDGFRTLEFDVTIQPGQVIPYRGMLVRW